MVAQRTNAAGVSTDIPSRANSRVTVPRFLSPINITLVPGARAMAL